MADLKLDEIAARISVHLKRMGADPKINRRIRQSNTQPFYLPWATRGGRYIQVTYVAYQTWTALTKSEALAYLAWLDAGNNGKHWNCLERMNAR